MRKLLAGFCAITVMSVIAAPVFAQEAPPPQKAPRTPVQRHLVSGREAPAAPRIVTGKAIILDAEKLRINDVDLRLFGVVPPQLSASFGPQARTVLDNLSNGKDVTCQVRDRDRDGRLLATCKTDGTDFAIALLQRGLAVTARGSLGSTEYAAPYIAAEQAAQTQKIGLWSMIVPPPAPVPVAVPETPKVAEAPKAEPAAKTDVKDDKPSAKEIAAREIVARDIAAKEAAAAKAATPIPTFVKAADEPASTTTTDRGFIARYQILVAGILMLATALSLLGTVIGYRRSEKRQEMRAIAAALRGELMAARAVCITRARSIRTEEDDKAAAWPRIRSTLYNAYVGRIGWLGAELSRQIASIYGQASDYAAFYNNGDESRAAETPKKQALETLIRHIESVLPKLATLELTGKLSSLRKPPRPAPPAAPVEIKNSVHEPVAVNAETPATDDKAGITAAAIAGAAAESALAATTEAAESAEPSPMPLWKAMRNFTRERIASVHKDLQKDMMEEHLPDYSALLEEEIESVGFPPEGEEAAEAITANVTRLRSNTGS